MSQRPLPPLDDVTALRQHLQLPDLHYVDISAANALVQAVQRWPLLTETESIRALNTAQRDALPEPATQTVRERQA